MPNTLEENVNRVKAAKTAIANAITAKGGTVGANDGLEDFASDIASIPSVEFSNSPASFSLVQNIRNLDVVVPYGCTSIATSAFAGCKGLTSIEIPITVTSIGNGAFRECSSLSSITIPASVASIGMHAFSNCYGLSYIKFESTTPPTVSSSNAWNFISASAKILVPAGTLETYKSANNYPDPSVYTYEEY